MKKNLSLFIMDDNQLKEIYSQQSKAISEQLVFANNGRKIYANRLNSSFSFDELKWLCRQFLKFDDLYCKCFRDKQNIDAELANLELDFSFIGVC